MEAKVGRPSQILVAIMNSLVGMERPRLGMGGAFSQLLVSLLLARAINLALPYKSMEDCRVEKADWSSKPCSDY